MKFFIHAVTYAFIFAGCCIAAVGIANRPSFQTFPAELVEPLGFERKERGAIL